MRVLMCALHKLRVMHGIKSMRILYLNDRISFETMLGEKETPCYAHLSVLMQDRPPTKSIRAALVHQEDLARRLSSLSA